jgi:hypothetical protein
MLGQADYFRMRRDYRDVTLRLGYRRERFGLT